VYIVFSNQNKSTRESFRRVKNVCHICYRGTSSTFEVRTYPRTALARLSPDDAGSYDSQPSYCTIRETTSSEPEIFAQTHNVEKTLNFGCQSRHDDGPAIGTNARSMTLRGAPPQA
jgi:hypothetical protein